MKHSLDRSRAFTVIEFIVIIVAVLVIVAVLLPTCSSRRPHGVRQIKDSSQVRGIVQAMSIWASNNKDSYPLPSAIDLDGDTVPDEGRAKDTTANIMSLMLYNGSVPTDLLISPAEANPNIQQYTGYEFNSPKAAVRPDKALWDPAFNVDFTGKKPGGFSYAHLMPNDERLARWSNTFSATEAVLGNRGPAIASVTKKSRPIVMATVKDTNSFTFLMHGARSTWEGNIGFNDSHVDFKTDYSDESLGMYASVDGLKWNDVLFYDEPDDAAQNNVFMGIFTKAGTSTSAFDAIWD